MTCGITKWTHGTNKHISWSAECLIPSVGARVCVYANETLIKRASAWSCAVLVVCEHVASRWVWTFSSNGADANVLTGWQLQNSIVTERLKHLIMHSFCTWILTPGCGGLALQNIDFNENAFPCRCTQFGHLDNFLRDNGWRRPPGHYRTTVPLVCSDQITQWEKFNFNFAVIPTEQWGDRLTTNVLEI